MRKSGTGRRVSAAIASVMVGGLLVSAHQEGAQQPVFRSGVELVTVDVGVIDRRGEPVRGLTAADFTVTVEGKPRRVLSAELVDMSAAKDRLASRPDPGTISTNEGAGLGRQFIFIIDQGTLETSSARYVARAAERFFAQLTFADRSALIQLPVGQRVSLTWSHGEVQQALQRLSGLTPSSPGWEYGSLSEARDIANRNATALQMVAQRECGSPGTISTGATGGTSTGGTGGGSAPPGSGGRGGGPGVAAGPGAGSGSSAMNTCLRNVQMQAETAWRTAHATSLASLASLRQVFDTLAGVRGDKTVILISGGWPLEPHDEVSMLRPVAASAENARVTLFPIFVPGSRFSASHRLMSSTPGFDQNLHSGPLEMLAGLTGGAFHRAEVSAEAMFERLGRQMAAYYRLGVAREPGDQDGKPRRLSVAVSRPDTTVRARAIFDTRTFEDRNWAARLAAALDSPIPFDGIPLRLTSYVGQDPDDRSRLHLTLAGTARQLEPGDATLQVVVRDLDGRRVLAGEPPVSQATEEGLEFAMNVPVAPGSYVVRVGVMDSAGRVGSVEHRVDARRASFGSVAATGLLLVRVPSASGAQPRIALGSARQDERLALELALDGDSAQPAATEVVFEIAKTVDGPAILTPSAALSRGPFEGMYLAQAVADLRVLPPGEYVARARVASGTGPAGSMHRSFEVIGSTSGASGGPAGGPAAGVVKTSPPSARALGAVSPFVRDDVLGPAVLGPVLERVGARSDASSPMIRELVDRARTAGLEHVPVSDTLAAESAVAAFLRGLKLYAAGSLEPAAAAFRAAMRASPDMYPAMVYLGACYAAGGRDKEAAGAWQTALIGTGDSLEVHHLLVDALLREGNAARALQSIERARAKWPDDERLKRRFVVAALLGDRRSEGLQAIDARLGRNEEVDEPTLALALHVLYEAFEQQRPVESVAADKARMLRLAERYRARGGPSLTLVDTWVAAVSAQK